MFAGRSPERNSKWARAAPASRGWERPLPRLRPADMTVAQVKGRMSVDLNIALTVYMKNKAEINFRKYSGSQLVQSLKADGSIKWL
jgi:hypothetical protein